MTTDVQSTSRKFFTFLKFSLHFVYIFRTVWNFLTKFGSSDSSFDKSILAPPYLKSEKSAHTQITITSYYIPLTYFMPWYEVETYIGDTVW